MPKLRAVWNVVRRAWITLGLGATAVFVAWSLLAYRASDYATSATQGTWAVQVSRTDGVWTFAPRGAAASNRVLVFFPGALVDPRAYAPLAQHAARRGFRAFIIELPRRGAFGGAESPELRQRVQRTFAVLPDSASIILGGHSRGAVVASSVAAERRHPIDGLVLIGSSHPRDVDLSRLTIPVTKIVGTRDGLASPGEVRQNAHLLPPHTRWIWIEGGNHSQFGWYGFQPMDRLARIPAAQQRNIMAHGVIDLLQHRGSAPDNLRQGPPAASRFVARVLADTAFTWTTASRPGMRVHAMAASYGAQQLQRLADSAVAVRQAILARLEMDSATPDGDVHLFLLADREDFEPLVGQRARGWTEPAANAILAAVAEGAPPPLRHEFAHLYTHRRWGTPKTYWLSEGVAVFAVGHCAGRSLHDWAQAAASAGDSLTIASLVPFDFSRAAPHLIAGSFVQHVAERHGIDAVRALWREGMDASEAATGLSAAALEESWRARLRRLPAPAPNVDMNAARVVRCET